MTQLHPKLVNKFQCYHDFNSDKQVLLLQVLSESCSCRNWINILLVFSWSFYIIPTSTIAIPFKNATLSSSRPPSHIPSHSPLYSPPPPTSAFQRLATPFSLKVPLSSVISKVHSVA